MEPCDLLKNIVIIEGEKQEKIRGTYCSSFAKVDDDGYRRNIDTRHKYSDGYCYNGYLWDYLIDPIVSDERSLMAAIKELKSIYVLWDIHSHEKIFIKDYWKFGKECILLLDSSMLIQYLHLLPEDIYIFDESYTWTIIFTHEYIDDDRYCLKAGTSLNKG